MKTVKPASVRAIEDRTYAAQTAVHGRTVTRGTELTIEGIRGRCAFIQHVSHVSGAEWVDVITSRGNSRTVRPAAIKTVHRSRRMGVVAA